jgi:hypothetical protein
MAFDKIARWKDLRVLNIKTMTFVEIVGKVENYCSVTSAGTHFIRNVFGKES